MTNRWTDYATVTSVTIGGIAFSNLNTTKQFIYRVTTWQPLISSSAATVFFVILHYDHLPPNVVSITQQPHDSQTDHINHTATASFTDWSYQSQSNHIIHRLIISITEQPRHSQTEHINHTATTSFTDWSYQSQSNHVIHRPNTSIIQQPHHSQSDHINHTTTASFTDWSHQSYSNHIIHRLITSITQQPHHSQTDRINHTATTSFTDWSHQSQSNHIIHSLITSITQQSFLHHIAVSSACLCLLGPWSCCDFDLWPQKLMRSSLLQNATKLKVWWKYVQYSSRHRTNEAKKCTFPQVGPQPSKVPTTPTPTDPELSRACCYQGPQIHSYYSYPQISSLA